MGLLQTLINYDLWLATSYAFMFYVFYVLCFYIFFLINQRSCLLEIAINFGKVYLSNPKHLLKSRWLQSDLISVSVSQFNNILQSYRHTKYIFILTVTKHSKIFFLSHSNNHTAALTLRLQQTLIKNAAYLHFKQFTPNLSLHLWCSCILSNVFLEDPCHFPLGVAVPVGVPLSSFLSVLSSLVWPREARLDRALSDMI